MIPQCDPKRNYLAHREEINKAIKNVLDKGRYILGKEVDRFEQEFAKFIGVKYSIGVANGTDALELGLRALGVRPNDKVVTVSHTAVATATAIARIGAEPIFVDIQNDCFTMDSYKLNNLIEQWEGPLPKAIIPVHIYGHPVDWTEISYIANKYNIPIIEDCSQAHGATYDGKMVGSFGSFGCFSLYPTKNLGAIGDGGVVTTNDSNLAKKIFLMREYGWEDRYVSKTFGTNSRLDEIQASVLRIKLKYLDAENKRRIDIASMYGKNLSGSNLLLPPKKSNVRHVYHQYVVRSNDRDRIMNELKGKKVGTLIHYPVPVHKQPLFEKEKLYKNSLNVTEDVSKSIFSLPIFPQLNNNELEEVCEKILNVLKALS